MDEFSPKKGRKQQQPPKQEKKQPGVEGDADYDSIVGWFAAGNRITLSDEQPFEEYFAELKKVPKLMETAQKFFPGKSDRETAFAMELLLEGLHQALKLTREDLDSTVTFSELLKFNILRTVK
jgi:magnesium chelatase subunit I